MYTKHQPQPTSLKKTSKRKEINVSTIKVIVHNFLLPIEGKCTSVLKSTEFVLVLKPAVNKIHLLLQMKTNILII